MTTSREKAAEEIERGLKSLLKGKQFEVAIALAEREKISGITALDYISQFNDINRRLDPQSKSIKEIHLRRLGELYKILDLPENHPIVLNTQIINSNFKYAPRNALL